MSTLVAPPSRSLLPTGLPGRPSWRVLIGLTLVVALVHLLVLGVAPMAVGPEPSPLANKFITRTIVIAPPAADKPAAPAAAAAPVEAKPPPPAKPRRPRAPTPPKPKPYPEPDATAQLAPETPDLTAQAATDSGATSPEAPASAPAAPEPAPTAAAGTGSGTTAGGSEASGTIAGTQALRIPGSVTLDFEATGQTGASPQRGVFGELVWLQDGSRYDGRLTLKAVFFTLLNWHSTGKIGPSGLEPERYSESRKAEVASHFVRDQGQIIFSNNAPPVPLQPGAQDRMSVMMQLGGLLAASPERYPAGTRISVQTVGVRDGDVWVFVVGDEEKLQLPAGEYTARKLTRTPRKEFDRKLELWLAPRYGYLPVRIKQTEANGDFADAHLRKPLPEAPAN
ncbi:hypothetical protein J2W28_005066 [Variovorax boronicumulans]|uniref:DUF3108 domain-containing protein n=1 Tax=Variovorax boronicumulans TaxID=436515 RepID=UPI002785F802|nr:DUF3108 domain-containing protein [Variovorax boronicumulans]MDP9994761.1 hypothetical protein [Variovorax boronicumulans]MDQ0005897.1 hypothetical protein [Variovorax boronicumulans]